jgi:preprotein translocase subunit YajC
MFAIALLAQTTSAPKGIGIGDLGFLIVAFGAMFFLVLRPQRKRTKQAQELQKSIAEGDEVILNSGIYGFVSEVNDTFVWLDVADEVEIRVARSAIASKVSTPSADAQTDSKK